MFATTVTGNPWLSQTVEIRAIRPEIDGVMTYDLAFQDPSAAAAYRFRPGQFNMLYLPGAGEAAISLSGDPATTGTLAHTIRTAGNVTRELAGLQPGQTLGLRGPFGSSWPLEQCIGRDVVLVAGGIGLPPLRPVIYELLRQQRLFGQMNLLYGARSPETQLYTNEYEEWAEGGLNVQTTVDRSQPGWKGNVGVVPLLLERLQTFDPQTALLFVCGPEVMLRFTAKAALERGMNSDQIWVSTERNMQCAVGLCGHCQLGPEFVCKDGPVFRYDHIAPYFKVEGL
jgi:NAD(P)H-flavin reductase